MDLKMALVLENNFTGAIRQAVKEQSKFKEITARVQEQLNTVRSKMKSLPQRLDISLGYKDLITRPIQLIGGKLKSIFRTKYSPEIKIKDKASSKLKVIGERLKKLGLTSRVIGKVINNVGLVLAKSVQGGALLEEQITAVRHFIAVNNQGLNQEEVTLRQDQFIKDLQDNADQTPFSIKEVMQAGATAVKITKGDTGLAMELVKLAENMSAVNPGRSVQEAMQALAELKGGRTGSLAGFGLAIPAEDLVKASGIKDATAIADLTEEQLTKAYQNIIKQRVQPTFAGGVEKYAKTGSGLWNTLQGKLENIMAQSGLKILEELKPVMQGIISFIDRHQDSLRAFGTLIAEGIGLAINMVKVLSPYVKAGLQIIWRIARPVIEVLGSALAGIRQLVLKIYEAFDQWKWVIDIIKGIAIAWGIYYGVIYGILGAIKAVKLAITAVVGVIKAVKLAIAAVNFVINANPIGLLITGIGLLIGLGILLVKNWDRVKNGLTRVWTSIKSTFTDIWVSLKEALSEVWVSIKDTFADIWLSIKNSIASIIDIIPDWLLPDSVKEWQKKIGLEYEIRQNEKQGEQLKQAEKLTSSGLGVVGLEYSPLLTPEDLKLPAAKGDNRTKVNSINLAKLADTLVLEKEMDVDQVANRLAYGVMERLNNYGGA